MLGGGGQLTHTNHKAYTHLHHKQGGKLTWIINEGVGPVVSFKQYVVQVTVGGSKWHALHLTDHEVLHKETPHAERDRV